MVLGHKLKNPVRIFGKHLKITNHLLYQPFYSELFREMNNHVCFSLMLISFNFQEVMCFPSQFSNDLQSHPQEQENYPEETEMNKLALYRRLQKGSSTRKQKVQKLW